MSVDLRPAVPADAPACAAILQGWLDSADWMPKLHHLAETEGWMAGDLFARAEVTVAEGAGAICGYLACQGDEIASLTLAPASRGQRIGAALLDRAMAGRSVLTLWTFVANRGAQRFYARHGFREIRRTAGENDEGLPDILMRWPA